MTETEKKIREISTSLLNEKKVDVIIGYEKGTMPLRMTPCFITDAMETHRLVWNPACENNLAKYLCDAKGKTAIIAKPCDARSIVTLLIEKQIDRNNVFIIGVSCLGVLDRNKIEGSLAGKEIKEAELDNGHIILKGEDFEETLPIKAYLDDSCSSCTHRNPPVFDVLATERVQEELCEKPASIEQLADERWKHFEKELSKCIRCYACKSVCPICYCKECFVDQSMPVWLGKTDHVSDIMVYHITRVLHVAGRCVDCGACSRACPMDINLRELTRKMRDLVKELYGFEAGINAECIPPLATFNQNDPQGFIK